MNAARPAQCPKCFGSGRIEAFRGTDNGRCFCCGGAGTVSVMPADVARLADNAARGMARVEVLYRAARGGARLPASEVQAAFDAAYGSPRWGKAADAFEALGYTVVS